MIVADSEPGFTFKDPDRRKKLEAAFPAIEKLIDEEMKKQGLPGLAVGIVIDGELALAKGFGVTSLASKTAPDADTVYRIGSITKSFTGLALLALRDDGVLSLDEPLSKWISEAHQLVYPSRDSTPITLRQLANHTSGLPRMGPFPPEDNPAEDVVVKSLVKLSLETAPATKWAYSNFAFSLLGIAIGRAAKAPFHDVVTARILKPLGMTATVWDHEAVASGRLAPAHQPGPQGPMPNTKPARLGAGDGAGGIYSSVRDMAKYVAFQLAAYPPRNADDGKLRRATLREAHSTGVPSSLKHTAPAVAISYGYGFGRYQSCALDDIVGHNGAIDSYRADMRFSPSRGVGIVVLTNFGNGDPPVISEAVLAELKKTGAMVARAPTPSASLNVAMKRLLGIYQQWDEAAFAKILARPIHPREKAELETYKQLHGACTAFEPVTMDTPNAGWFALTCERGSLRMQLTVSGAGLILGFSGLSRGIEPPAGFAKLAAAVLSLQRKWDDKAFAKHFAKAPMPAAQMKKMAATFHARHGDCKLGRPIHFGFDWGYEVMCKKENVEMYLETAPNDANQVMNIQLQPVHDEPKRCD